MSDIDKFLDRFEAELFRRYNLCEDGAATPSSILLAVCNAVAAAREPELRIAELPPERPR